MWRGDVRAQTLLRSSSDSTAEPEEIIKPGALTPTVQGLAAILFFFSSSSYQQHHPGLFLITLQTKLLPVLEDNATGWPVFL